MIVKLVELSDQHKNLTHMQIGNKSRINEKYLRMKIKMNHSTRGAYERTIKLGTIFWDNSTQIPNRYYFDLPIFKIDVVN